MAMGERTPLGLLSPAASARMAVAESILNSLAADIPSLSSIRLSANWMSSCAHPGEGAALYEAVQAVGLDLCPALGLTIPVGKDSMSMKCKWTDEATRENRSVTSPLSLIVTAYGPVKDSTLTWTPELQTLPNNESTCLVLLDLANGNQRMGGSVAGQVFNLLGDIAPDVVSPEIIKSCFQGLQALRRYSRSEDSSEESIILAYHDRSDGGLFATLTEMSFAGHAGFNIDISSLSSGNNNHMSALFNEELGAVIQIRASDIDVVKSTLVNHGFPIEHVHLLGSVLPLHSTDIIIQHNSKIIYSSSRVTLHQLWSKTSYHMQSLRDNPTCAESEFNALADPNDPGLSLHLTFDPSEVIYIQPSTFKPRVAILREQGINSFGEMAWAFHSAGFECIDLHMTDLISGSTELTSCVGLACPGGFSYGDVLGAGVGWAQSALLNPKARHSLETFFNRKNTFTIGVSIIHVFTCLY
jgi:phosphoribosylformylglycinamidine synthase